MGSPELKVLPVDLQAVVEGMDMQGGDFPVQYVLDTQTGRVFEFLTDNDAFGGENSQEEWLDTVEDDVREAFEAFEQGDARFEEIPQHETHEAYRLMEEFAETTDDERLGDELARTIRGPGAFRRFKDVLLDFPEQREKWFAFEAERKRGWAIEWLESIGIRPAEIA